MNKVEQFIEENSIIVGDKGNPVISKENALEAIRLVEENWKEQIEALTKEKEMYCNYWMEASDKIKCIKYILK